MLTKRDTHPLAGKTVILNCKSDLEDLNGKNFKVEDWWSNIAGKSWMDCIGNSTCLKYAIRSAFDSLPTDDEVVYGKVDSYEHLVHVSELQEVPNNQVFLNLQHILSEHTQASKDTITDKSILYDDLGIDSLDIVNVAGHIEEVFGISIPDDKLWKFKTVNEIEEFIKKILEKRKDPNV